MRSEDSSISVLWVAFAILVAATIFDLRSREIPDSLSVCLLAVALCATGFGLHSVGWLDLLAGTALGFGAGSLLFWMGGFGGGDVKLLASLGAVLGWRDELGLMFWMAVVGAGLAILSALRKQEEFAYVPAIALGLLAIIIRRYVA